MSGRFVGIGIDRYQDAGLEDLEYAVSDVEELAQLLGADLERFTCFDPTEGEIRELLARVREPMESAGPLVVLWSGHGRPSYNGYLRLLARDSGPGETAGVPIGDVFADCAASGASQLFFILDTCFSGQALSAASIVDEALRTMPPDATHLWTGILSSAQSDQFARDGSFGRILRRLLSHGPDNPDRRRRWSRHNVLLDAEDLGNALLLEWADDPQAQRPDFRKHGSADRGVFRNPVYEPEAAQGIQEHLLLAARGGAAQGERSWFTGRTDEVNEIVAWTNARSPGVRVLTGSPGTGKSALLGRVISLTVPQERARLLRDSHWLHDNPVPNSVHAHLYAQGLTLRRVTELLGRQLAEHEVIAPVEAEASWSPAELVAEVGRAVAASGRRRLPVVVVDGLDESRECFEIAKELLLKLAVHVPVIVSTREVRAAGDEPSLLHTLAPGGPQLDLDAPERRSQAHRDLRDYIHRRLKGRSPVMEAEAVARHFVRRRLGTDGGNDDHPFLLARLVTDQLLAEPVDTHAPDWQDRVSSSIGTAFEADLRRAVSLDDAPWSKGSAYRIATSLLTALAWAAGSGLPEEEWLTVARALDPETPVDRESVSWLLDRLGRYVVQDGESGVAVHRLTHRGIGEHLRPFTPGREQPFDPAAMAVAGALIARYGEQLAAGVAPNSPRYPWLYLWLHAADAGPGGVEALRDLQEPALAWDVARAWGAVGERLAEVGLLFDAADCSELAADGLRALPDADRSEEDLLSSLCQAASLRMECSDEVRARPLAEEALSIARRLEDLGLDVAYEVALLLVLSAIGRMTGGEPEESERLARESLAVSRGAGDEPRFSDLHARALVILGRALVLTGRMDQALRVSHESIVATRELALADPVFLTLLAMALTTRAMCELAGEPDAARRDAEEACRLLRSPDAFEVQREENLALTLSTLSRAHVLLDDLGAAREAAEESLRIARGCPAPERLLAMLLPVLATIAVKEVRFEEATACLQEATRLVRSLPALVGPGLQHLLVAGLSELAACQIEVLELEEAEQNAVEGLELCRSLPPDTPNLTDLRVGLLNSVGMVWLVQADQPGASLTRAEIPPEVHEAVELARTVGKDLPLIACLSTLGFWLLLVDAAEEAVTLFEEALERGRGLDVRGELMITALARPLNGLTNSLVTVGRTAEATVFAEEAVQLMRITGPTTGSRIAALADVMNRYDGCARAAGTSRAADRLRAEIEAELPRDVRPDFLMCSAFRAAPDDPRRVGWLADVLAEGYTGVLFDSRFLRSAVREVRAADPAAFDRAWHAHTGEPTPTWLLPGPVGTAAAWMDTPDYESERDFLTAHPELLDPGLDEAVAEALLVGENEAEAERLQWIRTTARAVGVVAAYEAREQSALWEFFVHATGDVQLELLETRGDALLALKPYERLVEESTLDYLWASGLLDLAAFTLAEDPQVAAAAQRVLQAFGSEDDDLYELFDQLARDGAFEVLGATAGLLLLDPEPAPEDEATLRFFQVLAAEGPGGGPVGAEGVAELDAARRLAGQEIVNAWIGLLAEIAPAHPVALQLILLLTRPLPDIASPGVPDAVE